ncbi:MAG: hypothetical protein D6805_08280 [Planctomycetota bacterium]|nr:MAG: hypothetical protein D6805_08280 [Planctomycetota bacterium]
MFAEDVLLWILRGMLFLLLVVCAYTDLAKGKVYNWCTLPAIVLGLFGNLFYGYALTQSWWSPPLIGSILGLLVGSSVFFLLYLMGGFGAGDMKLMGAIGALSGNLSFLVSAMVYTSLVGAMMAFGVLIWKGKLLSGLRSSFHLLFSTNKKKTAQERQLEETTILIPYGFAISVGTLWAYFVELLHNPFF